MRARERERDSRCVYMEACVCVCSEKPFPETVAAVATAAVEKKTRARGCVFLSLPLSLTRSPRRCTFTEVIVRLRAGRIHRESKRETHILPLSLSLSLSHTHTTRIYNVNQRCSLCLSRAEQRVSSSTSRSVNLLATTSNKTIETTSFSG